MTHTEEAELPYLLCIHVVTRSISISIVETNRGAGEKGILGQLDNTESGNDGNGRGLALETKPKTLKTFA